MLRNWGEMKVLLTGGAGFVGRNFLEAYPAIAPNRTELDLTSPRSVEQIIDYLPQTIVHLACDRANNELMAEHIAAAAFGCESRIIFLTTDVYGNEYAESKRRAESVIASVPRSLILRCSLLCDTETGERPLEWGRMLKGETVHLNTREIRNAMNIHALRELLCRFLRDGWYSEIMNVGGEPISRYELGRRFAEMRGGLGSPTPSGAGCDFTMDLSRAKKLYPDLIGLPVFAAVAVSG